MSTTPHFQNFDATEMQKFEASAAHWWDPNSDFKPLHDINPLRVDYIDTHASLANKKVVDIGCGGGLLCEAMATRQAHVTGIDIGETAINVARLHLHSSQLKIDYQHTDSHTLAQTSAETYDIVTCLELLEHVPDPAAVIQDCNQLVKPGGDIFFSTINRNPKSFLFAIIAAEYVLNIIPKGTHQYEKLIKPSEICAVARANKLTLQDLSGIYYNPFTQKHRIDDDVSINYIAHFIKAS